jgi:hypothetical protein
MASDEELYGLPIAGARPFEERERRLGPELFSHQEEAAKS